MQVCPLRLPSLRVCAGRLRQEHVRMKVRKKKSQPVARRQRLEQRAESRFPGPFLFAVMKEGLSEIRGVVLGAWLFLIEAIGYIALAGVVLLCVCAAWSV